VSPRRCGVATPLTIRDARPGGAAPLAVLVAELGDAADAAALELAVTELGPGERVIVADDDGALTGFANGAVVPFFDDGSRRLRLTAIAVSPSQRGRGVARSLIEELARWGRERGCGVIEVTSAGHRADAHAAYRALGFEETSRRFMRGL
jgi:GNAT superfamily N-acetyltransferase